MFEVCEHSRRLIKVPHPNGGGFQNEMIVRYVVYDHRTEQWHDRNTLSPFKSNLTAPFNTQEEAMAAVELLLALRRPATLASSFPTGDEGEEEK